MKNGKLKIESGIPLPTRASRGQHSIMKDMKVGDSVFFEDSQIAGNAAQCQLGVGNYQSRKEGNGRRVWRTK